MSASLARAASRDLVGRRADPALGRRRHPGLLRRHGGSLRGLVRHRVETAAVEGIVDTDDVELGAGLGRQLHGRRRRLVGSLGAIRGEQDRLHLGTSGVGRSRG
jgi:hypothetical protein